MGEHDGAQLAKSGNWEGRVFPSCLSHRVLRHVSIIVFPFAIAGRFGSFAVLAQCGRGRKRWRAGRGADSHRLEKRTPWRNDLVSHSVCQRRRRRQQRCRAIVVVCGEEPRRDLWARSTSSSVFVSATLESARCGDRTGPLRRRPLVGAAPAEEALHQVRLRRVIGVVAIVVVRDHVSATRTDVVEVDLFLERVVVLLLGVL